MCLAFLPPFFFALSFVTHIHHQEEGEGEEHSSVPHTHIQFKIRSFCFSFRSFVTFWVYIKVCTNLSLAQNRINQANLRSWSHLLFPLAIGLKANRSEPLHLLRQKLGQIRWKKKKKMKKK